MAARKASPRRSLRVPSSCAATSSAISRSSVISPIWRAPGIPGARRIGEITLDLEIADEVAAQLDGTRSERLGDAFLAAILVAHQPLVDDSGIAQPETVVERPAVPVDR